MNREEFGAFIRTLRKEKNLTQKELGSMLHLTDKAISKWETGQTLPDITMIEKIAEVLDVTTLELMQGKKIKEEQIAKEEVETVLHETVIQADIQTKRVRKYTKIKMVCGLFCLLCVLWAGRELVNVLLDKWSVNVESESHRCNIVSVYEKDMGSKKGAYYIYRERINSYLWNYHVACVDEKGNSSDVLLLQEQGMDLDRAPKLIRCENTLYILFDGLDNEDPVERLYDGVLGADAQGFLPHLYRYDLNTKVLEEIEIAKNTTTMLTDAFDYEGKDVYVAQRFQGVLGGLHLGFYRGDKTYISTGKAYENLFGDGGLKSTGCVYEDSYYVVGQKGIYVINLSGKKGKYIVKKDFSKCCRSEVAVLQQGDEIVFAVAAAYYEECNEYGEPQRMSTEVLFFNQSWQELGKITIPISICQIEWGQKSLIIAGREKNTYVSYLLDCAEQKAQKITDVNMPSVENACRLDELEINKKQWVYVPSVSTYYYLDGEKTYSLEE